MIIVIEPHADDAFLSVGGLLEGWIKAGQDVGIVTVYSGTRNRAKDAKAYADAIGAKWWGMGGVEYGSMKPGDPAGAFPTGEAAMAVWGMLGAPLGDGGRKVKHVILPLAIGEHPEHFEVKTVFQNSLVVPQSPRHPLHGTSVLYYVDQPYAAKLKAQEEVDDTLHGRKIFAIHRPGARKYRHVGLFKDQAMFFYYNSPRDLEWRTFELVVY